MTTQDYILQVIQADGPCTLKHVINDCKFQGFTKGFVQALQALKNARLVDTDDQDGETVAYFIGA